MLRGVHPTKRWTGCIGPMPSRLGDTPFPHSVPVPRCPDLSSQAPPTPPSVPSADVAQLSAQSCLPAAGEVSSSLADDPPEHLAFELGPPSEPTFFDVACPPDWDTDDAAFFGCFDPL